MRVLFGKSLRGRARVPGDKSISHRALILGAAARGSTRIAGLLDAEDIAATRRCLADLGVSITAANQENSWVVRGRAMALVEPAVVLDCGNAGTALRLLAGLLAGQPRFAVLSGDASLRARPMGRISGPLRAMGALVDGPGDGARAPLAIRGTALRNTVFVLPVASAQVKSALLLAGLQGEGTLQIRAPLPSRDHTERLLRAQGVVVSVEADGAGEQLTLEGPQTPEAVDIAIPGDLSSATFLIVGALICPGSDLIVEGVGLNPTRTGALDALRAMGARLEVEADSSPEPQGAVRARASDLRGIHIGGALIPRLIDELPVLAIAAALAEGETVVSGAAELRTKESDRISTIVAMLQAFGVEAEARPDGFAVQGRGGAPLDPGAVESRGDHRIAMAAAIGGLRARGPVEVRDAACIGTSFPDFASALAALSG